MEKLEEILSAFPNRKITVIGDVMLDEYIEGEVNRISPEAPVQVVTEKKRDYKMGGAGNVISNLSTLGVSNISLFSFVGKDEEAEILKEILDKKNIEYFFDINNITTKKTRIIGNNQQLLRLDKEETYNKNFSSDIKEKLLQKAKESDKIILSDYAKGVITYDLINFLRDYRDKIIINPKPKNKDLCANTFLTIANEKEAREMSGLSDINEAGEKLKKELNSHILVTRGEKGMTLFSDKKIDIPTYAREVYDVQGAGDTVIATVSLSVCAGASLEEAAIIGNYAAGIAVEKRGTYSVKLNELKERILGIEKKIVNLSELEKIINSSREEGKKIVWTNGCFDLFHLGHKYTLEKAKEFGDILVVGLDSDDSVKKLKGPQRPIYNENERAEILSSIKFVDYVTIFPFGAVADYVRKLKPDVFFKSKGYTMDTLNQEERKAVEEYGGKIVLLEGLNGFSTSNIINKIKTEK
jgi:D-beta-D-heptose 7-phosphate kinase / D-beta-D-heptose 1-phosphate adenosyltransferase